MTSSNSPADTSLRSRKLPLALIVLAVAALAGGIWSSLQLRTAQPAAAPMTAVTVVPTPRKIAAVELIDKNNAAFGAANFEGQWSLVFMGFTSCGHVCPMTMARIRTIRDGVSTPLNVVFVSVDPNRDSPEKIKSYVEGYASNFMGVTGSPAELDKLANALGAPYFVDTDPENYIVDHPSTLFLINPDAALAGVISQPLEIEAVIAELDELLGAG